MKQQTLTGFREVRQDHPTGEVPDGHGPDHPWPEVTAAVETVYPKISEAGGRPADSSGADAEDLLSAAVVQPVGPGRGKKSCTTRCYAQLRWH